MENQHRPGSRPRVTIVEWPGQVLRCVPQSRAVFPSKNQLKILEAKTTNPAHADRGGGAEPTCGIGAMIRVSTPLVMVFHGGMFVLQPYFLLPMETNIFPTVVSG